MADGFLLLFDSPLWMEWGKDNYLKKMGQIGKGKLPLMELGEEKTHQLGIGHSLLRFKNATISGSHSQSDFSETLYIPKFHIILFQFQ
jgi:hypothetical protein